MAVTINAAAFGMSEKEALPIYARLIARIWLTAVWEGDKLIIEQQKGIEYLGDYIITLPPEKQGYGWYNAGFLLNHMELWHTMHDLFGDKYYEENALVEILSQSVHDALGIFRSPLN